MDRFHTSDINEETADLGCISNCPDGFMSNGPTDNVGFYHLSLINEC